MIVQVSAVLRRTVCDDNRDKSHLELGCFPLCKTKSRSGWTNQSERTTFSGKFPPGPRHSIYVLTEISRNFGIMESTPGDKGHGYPLGGPGILNAWLPEIYI